MKMMPPSEMVSGLRSFLASVQFYGNFLPNLASVTEPLHHLTKKDVPWKWGMEEQAAFQKLKYLLCDDTILVHFDPSLPIGISCDASEVGLGAVLFHRYSDGSERPISNASKTLTSTQAWIQSDTERGTGYHLRPQQVPPVPLWLYFHLGLRPQTTYCFVWTNESNSCSCC